MVCAACPLCDLQDKNYPEAARLAFALKHPGRLLAVVQRAAASKGSGAGQQAVLGALVASMSAADIRTALEYCREWNTHGKHCHAAQAMLAALLKRHKPQALAQVPGERLTRAVAAVGNAAMLRARVSSTGFPVQCSGQAVGTSRDLVDAALLDLLCLEPVPLD